MGYEFNKVARYCLNRNNCCVIGLYGMIFNRRSEIIYTAKTDLKGYFIRKMNWRLLMTEFKELKVQIQKQALTYYNRMFKSPIQILKNR